MAKVINYKPKKIFVVTLDIFDSPSKNVTRYCSFSHYQSRFKKIEPNSTDKIEYEKVCKANKEINYQKVKKADNKSIKKEENKTIKNTKQKPIKKALNKLIHKALAG